MDNDLIKKFLHHLRDQIILLGGDVGIASLLNDIDSVKLSDIEYLKKKISN